MESGNIFVIIPIVILLTIFTGCITEVEYGNSNQDVSPVESIPTDGNISIACWNLQIFGPSKASNHTLIDYYVEKLDDYDIFIVQEIRDASGEAIEILAQEFPDYEYILSNRAGQSSSKEQYAVFYNNQSTFVDYYDYQSEYQDEMQRPPLKVIFTSNNWTFTLFTIHTQPSNVPGELSIMEAIIGNTTGDTIIIGDLNADGSYYDEDNIEHFTDWSWVVTNDIDTTVATSDNTYDRIMINEETENNYVSFGVMDDVNKDQSDHYLIHANFNNHAE